MKHLFQSFQMIIVLVFSFSLISCHDENNDPVNTSKPLISTMSNFSKDGTMHGKETYKYDSNGRLAEINDDDKYKVVFEYSPSSITVKEYEDDDLDFTSIFYLNSQSLCDYTTSEDEDTITYTYDNEGYRKTSIEISGYSTYSEDYTVANQNYVTIKTEDKYVSQESAKAQQSNFVGKSAFMKTLARRLNSPYSLKSASDYISSYTTEYLFYTDHTNTIDFENMGIFFFGKQNLNPIKEETEISADWPDRTNTYTYEYDAKGRITKKTYDFGGYEVYTYVE